MKIQKVTIKKANQLTLLSSNTESDSESDSGGVIFGAVNFFVTHSELFRSFSKFNKIIKHKNRRVRQRQKYIK